MSELLSFLFDPFQLEFMQRGLLASLFLSLSGGLLGSLLILRRLALMGNALAHSQTIVQTRARAPHAEQPHRAVVTTELSVT